MKLGLLALSGVRAHDEELTRLGMSLPAFAPRSEAIASVPSLGLLTLAGLTPAPWVPEYREISGDLPEDLPGEYDAVAISSFTARIKDAYRLSERYRRQGTRVVLGGLHVTARPDEALSQADAVVLGEGEPVWPQVLRDLRTDRLKPVYDAREEPFDLSRSPLPRFDLLDPDRYDRLPVQSQRGCPFDCTFCASSIRLVPGFRTKPVDRIIAEVRAIRSLTRRPFIELADDNTFADKAHARRLVEALSSEGVRWFTESDISIARHPDLLARMRDSGCVQVLVGLEHPRAEALRGLELRSDWKAGRCDDYMEDIERIQGHGISVNGCFVLGLDTTGPECFEEVRTFVEESGLHQVQITIQTPFPGTPLYAKLRNEGRLLVEDPWERCTLFDVTFRPALMSVEELREGFLRLAESLYSEEAALRRRGRLRDMMRRGGSSSRSERRMPVR